MYKLGPWRRFMWVLTGTAFVPPSCIDLNPPRVVTVQTPVYCYQSLGKPECYAEPQPGQEYRFLGAQIPVHVPSPWSMPAAQPGGAGPRPTQDGPPN